MNAKKFIFTVVILLVVAVGLMYILVPSSPQVETTNPKKIALLLASDLQLPGVDGMKEGLKQLGYKEGKDFVLELKNPKGDRDLAKQMAADIVASKPDLIMPFSTSASRAVLDANEKTKIPVIFVDVGNFQELGIKNIQRPGGFRTGVVVDNVAAAPKRMEIMKTLLPNMKKIAILVNHKHVSYDEILKVHEEGAKKLGIKALWYKVSTKEELPVAMKQIVTDKPDVFMTTSEAVISGNADLIAPVLRAAKIPSIDFNVERGVVAGYLMVYGVSRYGIGMQSSRLVDKVLRGSDPGDLPIEFASSLNFEINAALAKEMGVSIPESLLLQANKIHQ